MTQVLFILSPYAFSGVLFLCSAVLLFFSLRYRYRPTQFYFIRHGETILNKQHIKQGADGLLSEKGMMQAHNAGEALRHLHIQKIFSSPYERAVQTATIMQESLHCPIVVKPVLQERKSASEVLKKKTDDPEVVRITGLTAYGYHADDYRYSDEENFVDLRSRAKKCLKMLSHVPEKRVVIVTHHAFLQVFLSYLLYRDDLTAEDLVRLSFFNPAENGGITLCVYHPRHGIYTDTKGWEIRTYNQLVEFTRQ